MAVRRPDPLHPGQDGGPRGEALDEALADTRASDEVLPAAPERPESLDLPTIASGGPSPPAADAGPAGLVPRGAGIGRYLVLGSLGAGAMGVVYAAYDPELDRKVAIKLLNPLTSGSRDANHGRARLLREAQAMARLSHPQVIAVYDVGTFAGQVFVAMEFVDGGTLTEWLKEAPRPWQKILPIFVLAGRGLGAAHAAGLIHRDFKPDNVLVGKDGRVRVTDFGLVRSLSRPAARPGAATEAGAPTEAPAVPAALGALASDEDSDEARETHLDGQKKEAEQRAHSLGASLTRTGAFVGTPRYMAPEQYTASQVDQRTDEFSFCVALYEALYRQRPFPGDNFSDLATSVMQGRVSPPPGRTRVPAWLYRVLLRGLSPDPRDRYQTMEALLHALSRDPQRTRRRSLVVLGSLALCALGGAAYVRIQRQTQAICQGAESKLTGIWDAGRKQVVHDALLKTGKPYAGDAWQRVSQALDAYTQGWVAMHTEACRATYVRGEQSQALLDLRMGCLGRRLQDISAFTALLVKADGEVVEKAAQASAAFPPLQSCADVTALTAPVPPPEDAATRARTTALYRQMAEVRALEKAGKYKEALTQARAAAAAAAGLGYRPAEAEALYLLGDIEQKSGDPKAAELVLHQAAVAGVAGRHRKVVAQAWALLTVVVGYQQRRPEEGQKWGQLARAAVDATDGNEEVKAQLENSLGNILAELSRYDEALGHHRAALAIHRQLFGAEHIEVADDLNDLALVLRRQGQLAESLSVHKQALRIKELALGPYHPDLSTHLRNIALVLREQGRYAEAEGYLQRALDILRKTLGEEHIQTTEAQMPLGRLYEVQGRYAEAQRVYEQVLAIRRRTLGPADRRVAVAHYELGNVLRMQGRHGEALREHQRALQIQTEGRAEPAQLARTEFAVAQDLRALASPRDRQRATELALKARVTYEQLGDKDQAELIKAWLSPGNTQGQAGKGSQSDKVR